jgi:uncharacterized protein
MSSALLVLLLVGAEPAASHPELAEQRALALQLVELVQPESSYRAGLQQMMDQMLPSLEAQARASGKPLPADTRQRMNAVLLEVVPYPEMKQWSAEIYAQRFTRAELKELLAFYRTPVGRKLASKLPEIMGEAGKKMSEVLPQRLPAALRRHGLIGDGQEQSPPQSPEPAKQQKL